MINIDYRNEHRILQEKLSFSILKNLTLLSLYIKYQHMLLFCSWNLYSTMEWQWFVRVCTVLRKMCTVCSRILAHFHIGTPFRNMDKKSWTYSMYVELRNDIFTSCVIKEEFLTSLKIFITPFFLILLNLAYCMFMKSWPI